MTDRERDPLGAHRFRVSCDLLPALGFTEVRGLSVRVVTGEDDESADRSRRRPPVRWRRRGGGARRPRVETRSPPLELTRGVTDDQSLWRWHRDWVAGDVDPQDVRVCLLDAAGDPARGWVCRGATPVRWTGPHLVADRAAVATETLALEHEGIDAIASLDECEEA